MNKHPSLIQIERHVAGELPLVDMERIASHLYACSECGNLLVRLRDEAELLKDVFSEVPGFEPVSDRLAAAIAETSGISLVQAPRSYPLVRRLAWACAVVVLIGAPSLWGLFALNSSMPSVVGSIARGETPLTAFLVSTLLKTIC